MSSFETLFGGAGGLIIVFLILMAVLWFLLPFAVFGVKGLLRDILAREKAIETELKLLNSSFARIAHAAEADDSPATQK